MKRYAFRTTRERIRKNQQSFLQALLIVIIIGIGKAATMVQEVAKSEQDYKHHNATRSRCPDCGKFLLERNTKQGKMIVCPDRSCGYKLRDKKNLTYRRCPQCHKKMELRQGKAGKFFQCKPCNVTLSSLLNQDGHIHILICHCTHSFETDTQFNFISCLQTQII